MPAGSASSAGGGRASAPYHDDYGISSYNQISGIAGGFVGLGWRAGVVALGAVNRQTHAGTRGARLTVATECMHNVLTAAQ